MPTELRDGIWWLQCTGVNVYLVDDAGALTLVDAGTPFDAGRIEGAIEDVGFAPEDLERILITHYDMDHVGAAARLGVDVPVYVGRADADWLSGETRPPLRGRKALVQLASEPIVGTVSGDRVRRVDDGDDVGGFTALHTPGHTPGHTVFIHESHEAAFLGDTVVERRGMLRPSAWFLANDPSAFRRSLKDVSARTDDFEVAAMGHGTPFGSEGSERLRETAEGM